MDKETWGTLSEEAKVIWDSMDPTDKRKILGYSQRRKDRPTTLANQHDILQPEEDVSKGQDVAPDTVEAPEDHRMVMKTIVTDPTTTPVT